MMVCECVKCTSTSITMVWMQWDPSIHQPECLRCTCTRCGYKWDQPTADAVRDPLPGRLTPAEALRELRQ